MEAWVAAGKNDPNKALINPNTPIQAAAAITMRRRVAKVGEILFWSALPNWRIFVALSISWLSSHIVSALFLNLDIPVKHHELDFYAGMTRKAP